ncbi:hypothetical protein SEA_STARPLATINUM_117 [Streptomyces phage StarPlatinum]|uniref:Uncharacterized protein n=1 Tax=Streptomyces phage StarPlatinum TaxID=2283265 RepID=A0A345M8N8_9CAUD|nr:hypothetical protein HWB77_gp178 [Streptomyces phage StarPlatinum]AXH66859.1 hypothetical protein SEA_STARPLATINUM_117 [Streptomyces phage StarPlatinum]
MDSKKGLEVGTKVIVGSDKKKGEIWELGTNPTLVKVLMKEGPWEGQVMLVVLKQVKIA